MRQPSRRREHREPPPELAFRLGQQLVAPRERSAHRAMSFGYVAVMALEPELFAHVLVDRLELCPRRPAGGKLDGQGMPPALEQIEAISGRFSAVGPKLLSRDGTRSTKSCRPGHRSKSAVVTVFPGFGNSEWMEKEDPLAVDLQWFAAGRQNPQRRARLEQGRRELGGRLDDVLAVVENEQSARRHRTSDLLIQRSASVLNHTKRPRDRCRDQCRAVDVRKLSDPDAARKGRSSSAPYLPCETALPDPARPEQGHES